MNRDSVNWQGYVPAVTTPFEQNGDLDLTAFRQLLTWLAAEGMHGLIIAGTTGEWFSLENSEFKCLFAAAGEVLKGEMPLIAGCNAFTAKDVIKKAVIAEQSGFDGILVTPPPYIRPSESEVIAFYEDVNKDTPLPICIYNWPPGTNIDLDTETLVTIAALQNVVAIKNSTADSKHFQDVMHRLNREIRIFGVPMDASGAELILNGEADGTMGAGAALGHIQPDFFNALWEGDKQRALASARLDQRIMSDWFLPDYTARFGSAQAIFKAALNLQGQPGGFPRRPILPLDEKGIDSVKATLVATGQL